MTKHKKRNALTPDVQPLLNTSTDLASHPAARDAVADPAMSDLDRCVSAAVERLSTVVVQETAALKSGRFVDLKDFTLRKSHGLLELDRTLRRFAGRTLSPETLSRLRGLRRDLDLNRATLALHLEAVREIASMLTDVIRKTDCDGTYSRSAASAT